MNDHDHIVWFVSWVFAHIASGIAVAATLAGILPPFAALIALLWYVIQIAESETFKKLKRRRREQEIKRLEAKILRLRTLNDPGRPPA